MRNIGLIARRELMSYLGSPTGTVIVAAVLLIDGLLFNGFALGGGRRLSAEVMSDFFYFSSGTTMIVGILLAMRLISEERQNATLVLLRSAPITSWEIVLGKYLAAVGFLVALTLATVYMPLLILVNGQVSFGHLAAGYLGLALLGSATLAIGLFASTLARSQLVAAILGAAILVGLLVLWLVARVTDPPLAEILRSLALYSQHFDPFGKGTIHTRDVLYYATVSYFFLLASVRSLDAQRWD